jgi:hypothetical protein
MGASLRKKGRCGNRRFLLFWERHYEKREGAETVGFCFSGSVYEKLKDNYHNVFFYKNGIIELD